MNANSYKLFSCLLAFGPTCHRNLKFFWGFEVWLCSDNSQVLMVVSLNLIGKGNSYIWINWRGDIAWRIVINSRLYYHITLESSTGTKPYMQSEKALKYSWRRLVCDGRTGGGVGLCILFIYLTFVCLCPRSRAVGFLDLSLHVPPSIDCEFFISLRHQFFNLNKKKWNFYNTKN